MVLFSGALPQSSALVIAFALFPGQALAENIVTKLRMHMRSVSLNSGFFKNLKSRQRDFSISWENLFFYLIRFSKGETV
jgi:hypothetical protein